MRSHRRRGLVQVLTGLLLLGAAVQAERAAAQRVVKPYFLILIDTSGSMTNSTGSGTNSCGQAKTKINDAKCVLGKLVNSYGDVVFGLARFRETACSACTPSGINCGSCNESTGQYCPSWSLTDNRGEILVPILDDNQNRILKWVNFNCSGCTKDDIGADPEVYAANADTPLAGSLRSLRNYFQGGMQDGFDTPLRNDADRACRPYRVIVLTDGQETCQALSNTYVAADELRATSFGGATYEIKTYVIGFGVSAGSSYTENLAQHGGTDAPGTYRAFYATDETSLSLAFNQIIADSVKLEMCNGQDDDCDGETDEGYNVGAPCTVGTGACQRSGHLVCDGLWATKCDAQMGDGGVEICNGIDDDCDGLTDEAPANCSGCVPQPEICDGHDNNCNGRIDEGISRTCGVNVGICTKGTQTCVELSAPAASGTWTACTGQGPLPEQCNDLDDDCDGVTDGLVDTCHDPSNPLIGQCRAGTTVCTHGVWGACVGEVLPTDEVCDGLDNDCDGETDEGDPGGGQPCMTACGAGVTACVNGQLVCQSSGGGQPEVCNGIDDDCDGLTDEDQPSLGPCDDNGTLCIQGTLECVNGSYQCIGGVPKQPEKCDCVDNDCDGQTDEQDDGPLCDPGATCLGGPYCQCALPCSEEEFPCPVGRTCVTVDGGGRFCVVDPCYGMTCPPTAGGGLTTCVDGQCVSVCEVVSCNPPLVCRPSDGRCVEDDCLGFPERCQPTEVCVAGVCQADPCAAVTCPDPQQHCTDGVCVGSCAGVECPPGQACRHGVCTEDPCAGMTCPAGQTCDFWTGTCTSDRCADVTCGPGLVCDPATGDCQKDPCLGVTCPAGQQCRGGDCYWPSELGDGGIVHTYVTAAGGGRSCMAGGGAGAADAGLLLLGALLLWVRRRR